MYKLVRKLRHEEKKRKEKERRGRRTASELQEAALVSLVHELTGERGGREKGGGERGRRRRQERIWNSRSSGQAFPLSDHQYRADIA